MANRFIFSLRFSSKVLIKIFGLAAILVFLMSLFRMNLFFLNVYYLMPELNISEILQSFCAGIRFDVLVFGFMLLPLYPIIIMQAFFEKWPNFLFGFYKFYFGLAWLGISMTTYVDFFSFIKTGKRMRFDDYNQWTFEGLLELISSAKTNQVVVFSVISLALLILGMMFIKALKFGNWKDEFSPKAAGSTEAFWRIVLPLILIILAARGTVTPHHLGLEHSEVSNSKELNEMALNAIWCFDK